MLLLALHLALPAAHADDADVPAAAEEAGPGWAATEARYAVTIPAEGPLVVTLEWRFTAATPRWAELPLVGPGLVVSSVTGPAVAGPGGLYALLSPTAGTPGPNGATTTIRVTGTLDPQGPGAARLPVLPAARQRVVVDAPGLDVTVAGATDGWLAAANSLALTWRPHVADAAPRAVQPLVHAEATTAVWAEPDPRQGGVLISQTVARWKVVRGAVDRFELDVAGLEEVDAEGPNLARATREGSRLVLTPRSPVRGTFEVKVRARQALATGAEAPAPAPRPVASRVERWYTVGRAEDAELVPIGGPRSVPARALPEWGRGLSDTPIVSSWQGDAPLRVRLARFTPLMGPDTVIERAVLVVAAAAEGRALVRTTWHVRNERRQYLHVTPPPGVRPMTARVSGEPVLVLSDGAGGVYIPLEKSVETVQGLLTFPVELTWIAEGEAWEKKGERALRLPAVDAPIQAAEWEVYLPRGVTSKDATASVAPPPEEEAGEAELQRAVEAYKKNDFAASNAYLEQARSSGSTSANVDRLQSNLDALLGGDDAKDTGVEDVATRRVRELANAKTVTLQVEQEKKVEEARRALQSGDVDKAELYLEEVIALAEDIGVTEQKESAEQAGKKQAATEMLASVKKQKSSSMGPSSATRTPVTKAPPQLGAGGQPPPQRPPRDEEPPPQVAADAEAYGLPPDVRFGGESTDENHWVLDGVTPIQETVAAEEPTPIVAEELEEEPPPEPEVTTQTATTTDPVRVLQSLPGVATSGKRGGRADGRGVKDMPARGPRKGEPAPDADQDAVADEQDATGTEDGEPAPVRYKQKTEIDFESLDIEGELVKPQGALVLDRKKASNAPLVKLRQDFDEEMEPDEAGASGGLAAPPPPPPPKGGPARAPEAPPPRTGADVAAAKPAQPSASATTPLAPPATAAPIEDFAPEPERRAALDVKAAPLTLAMPLGGEVVRSTAALLPAGATPTLTVPYRTTKPGAAR